MTVSNPADLSCLRSKREFVANYLSPLLKAADRSIISVSYRSVVLDKAEGVTPQDNDHHFNEEIEIIRRSLYSGDERSVIVPVSCDSEAMMIKDVIDNGDFF